MCYYIRISTSMNLCKTDLNFARLSLWPLIHSCLHPLSSAQFGCHLCFLDKISNIDSFWEWWSSVLPATEISSWLQSPNKSRLPYMVCGFVMLFTHECLSFYTEQNPWAKTFPFSSTKRESGSKYSATGGSGRRGKGGADGQRGKALPFLDHADVSVWCGEASSYVKNSEKLLLNVANCGCNLTNE